MYQSCISCRRRSPWRGSPQADRAWTRRYRADAASCFPRDARDVVDKRWLLRTQSSSRFGYIGKRWTMARAPRSNIQSKATPAAKRPTSATAARTVIKTAAGSKLGRRRPDGFVVSSKRAGTRILSQPPSKSGKFLTKESAGTSGDKRTEAIRKVHAAFASGSVDVLVIAVDDVGSLTSQDVADILNVSRPCVVKLPRRVSCHVRWSAPIIGSGHTMSGRTTNECALSVVPLSMPCRARWTIGTRISERGRSAVCLRP
jgi:hypothetical protein